MPCEQKHAQVPSMLGLGEEPWFLHEFAFKPFSVHIMFPAFTTATTWASPAPVASRCARIDWQIWLATCSCGTSPSAVLWPPVCCRERLGRCAAMPGGVMVHGPMLPIHCSSRAVCRQQVLVWCAADTLHSGVGDSLSSSRCCCVKRPRNIVPKLLQCHGCRRSSGLNPTCCVQGTCMLANVHHPLPDGRSARHCTTCVLQHPCWFAPSFTVSVKHVCVACVYCQGDIAQMSDDDFFSLILMPVVEAHIPFAAHVCQLQG